MFRDTIPKHWHFTLGLRVNPEVPHRELDTNNLVLTNSLKYWSTTHQEGRSVTLGFTIRTVDPSFGHISQHSRTLTSTTPY